MTETAPHAIRIGTRGSPLALAQAREIRARLIAAHPALAEPEAIEIVVISTTGDRVVDRNLAAIGGKGLFTKEIEQALSDGGIDLAVHSMKDVPTVLPDGLVIDCFPPREDPRDALFSASGGGLESLAPGAVVGTSSLRRQALLLYARPDLRIVPFRGNVETRLAKLAAGRVDATLLAVAGLKRLGKEHLVTTILPPEIMLPAAAQGAIGIERRLDDSRISRLLEPLDDATTNWQVTAERALLAELDGSCRTPIGALATIGGASLRLAALVIELDGTGRHAVEITGAIEDAERIGRQAGMQLKALQRG
ncbi:MAG: hydroxymethylbilane synthase [Rhodospirillales bacterium]|nr:hydroxymethylbilane synthase [Rhodospirillales bacterium]